MLYSPLEIFTFTSVISNLALQQIDAVQRRLITSVYMLPLHSPCLLFNASTLNRNTLLLAGQQWWPNHCPSPLPGFQLGKTLSAVSPILRAAALLSFPIVPMAVSILHTDWAGKPLQPCDLPLGEVPFGPGSLGLYLHSPIFTFPPGSVLPPGSWLFSPCYLPSPLLEMGRSKTLSSCAWHSNDHVASACAKGVSCPLASWSCSDACMSDLFILGVSVHHYNSALWHLKFLHHGWKRKLKLSWSYVEA